MILRRDFWELSDELLNKIWFVDWYYINRAYVLCKGSSF